MLYSYWQPIYSVTIRCVYKLAMVILPWMYLPLPRESITLPYPVITS